MFYHSYKHNKRRSCECNGYTKHCYTRLKYFHHTLVANIALVLVLSVLCHNNVTCTFVKYGYEQEFFTNLSHANGRSFIAQWCILFIPWCLIFFLKYSSFSHYTVNTPTPCFGAITAVKTVQVTELKQKHFWII